MSVPQTATSNGTALYRKRMAARLSPDHFRESQGLWFSSIGLGSYLGQADDVVDASYRAAIRHAIEMGCNVIDSAINYRCQRSERIIGSTLQQLFNESKAKREELIIATKGGFFPFDRVQPRNPQIYFHETLIQTGLLTAKDIVAGCHSIAPNYIEHQLARSLENLKLDAVDIYYLHNPEMQLEEISRDEFYRRLRAAFELLERKVAEGKIGMYGTATWNGYRNRVNAVDHLELEQLVALAREVAGNNHHFRVIQLPYNLAMTEAFLLKNQSLSKEQRSLLEVAQNLGITVMTSASIMQSRLANNLPDEIRQHFSELQTDAQRAIQFARSTPGVTTALVGMSRFIHVEENFQTAMLPPARLAEFLKLFSRST